MKASDYILEDVEAYLLNLRQEGRDDNFLPDAKKKGRWWARHFNSLREYDLYCYCNSKHIESPEDLFVDTWR